MNERYGDVTKLFLTRASQLPLDRGVSHQEPGACDGARYGHELKFVHTNLTTGLGKMWHHGTRCVFL